MSVCPICENAHGDECSPSALRARIEREAETVTKLTGDVATLEETAGLLGADREALWKVVRDACAVLRVTDDDEKDWPKLTAAVTALAARLAEAEVELLDLRSGKDRLIEALGATGEDRRWKWLIAAVWDLRRDLAEALATLANERGEGEPPCEGWSARSRGDLVRWVRFSARPGRTLDVVRQAGDEPGVVRCHWWDREIDKDGDVTATYAEGYAPTFRAAMRAASERLRGLS